MPRRAVLLTDKAVRQLSYNKEKNRKAYHSVGGADGLILQCQPPKDPSDPVPKSWIQRVRIEGKQRELGLGSYPTVSLAEARKRANDNKARILAGENPLADKEARRAEAAERARKAVKFSQLADEYFADRLATSGARDPERKVKKERNQVAKYVEPFIGSKSPQHITPALISEMLRPIWLEMPETAMRVRLHTQNILRMAKAKDLFAGDNPADLDRIKHLLPQIKSKRADIKHRKQTGNQPALQIADTARLWALLGTQKQLADRALEFHILTASRPIESRSAKWEHIDLENKVWTIPAEVMKMGVEHRVPLSDAAIDLLNALPREGDYLFSSSGKEGFVSDTAMRKRISRLHELDLANGNPGFIDPNECDKEGNPRIASLHGMRATFSVWARDIGNYSREITDRCLAHQETNKVTRAYQRTDFLEKRAPIMQAWSEFLMGKGVQAQTTATVTAIGSIKA